MANGRSFRSSTCARKILNASPGFIPKRAKTFSALRKRAVGTRARKSVVVDMLQKCSNVLRSQPASPAWFHGTFPRGKCGRASAAIFRLPFPRHSEAPVDALAPATWWGPGSNPGEELHRNTWINLSRESAQIAAATAGRNSLGAAWSGRSPRLSEPGYLSAISSKSGQSKEIARNSSLRWTRFPMFRRKRAMNCRSESERIFCFAQADGMEEALDPPQVGAGPFAGTKIEVRRRSLGCANGIAPALRSYVASTSKDIEVNVSADEVTLNGEKKM